MIAVLCESPHRYITCNVVHAQCNIITVTLFIKNFTSATH